MDTRTRQASASTKRPSHKRRFTRTQEARAAGDAIVSAEGADDGVTDLRELRLPKGSHTRWDHHHVSVKPHEAFAAMRKAVQIAGVPTALTSTPLYLVLAQAAREAGIVVLLVGEGADGLFAGYRSYLTLTPATAPIQFYLDLRRCELVSRLLEPTLQRAAVTALIDRVGDSASGPAAVLAHERILSLRPLLDRTDTLTMSCSIEARTPFLHGDVPAVAAALPWEQKVAGGQTKVALRAAYANRLPAIAAGVKVPFRAPWAHWMREKLRTDVRDVLRSGEIDLGDLGIDPAGVRYVLNAALRGDRVAGQLCFTLCSLVFWAEDQRQRRAARSRNQRLPFT